MKPKRISVRFNLNHEADGRAWEYLQKAQDSKNKTVIAALIAFFEPQTALADVIRQTIRECLSGAAVAPARTADASLALSEDESALLDTLDEFLTD